MSTPRRASLRARLIAALLAATGVKRVAYAPGRFLAGRPRRLPAADDPVPRLPHGVVVERWPGEPVATLIPTVTSGRPPVVYLHGGAHAAPVRRAHWVYAARLALALGAPVTLPRYPLAPESTVHESLAMLEGVVRRVAADGGFVLVGDSAGAGKALALVTSRAVRPLALVLNSPFVDARTGARSGSAAERRDPLLVAAHLEVLARAYAAHAGVDDPLVSPIDAPLADLPPTAIFTGTRDLLHEDAVELRRRFEEAGVDAWLSTHHEMIHDWMLLPIPEAGRQIAETVSFVDSVRDGGSGP